MSAGDHHVYPTQDLIEHSTNGEDCLCGPETIPVEREDGSIAYVISHHALDGREHFEEGHDRAECALCSSVASPHREPA